MIKYVLWLEIATGKIPADISYVHPYLRAIIHIRTHAHYPLRVETVPIFVTCGQNVLAGIPVAREEPEFGGDKR